MTSIKLKLGDVSGVREWCLCGGCNEKFQVVCLGVDEENALVQLCGECLKSGDIDGRLERRAQRMEETAKWIRSLKGRIQAPTFKEWEQANEKAEREFERAYPRDARDAR